MNLETAKLVEKMVIDYYANEDKMNAKRREANPELWKDTIRAVRHTKDDGEWYVNIDVYGENEHAIVHAPQSVLNNLFALKSAKFVDYVGVYAHKDIRENHVLSILVH